MKKLNGFNNGKDSFDGVGNIPGPFDTSWKENPISEVIKEASTIALKNTYKPMTYTSKEVMPDFSSKSLDIIEQIQLFDNLDASIKDYFKKKCINLARHGKLTLGYTTDIEFNSKLYITSANIITNEETSQDLITVHYEIHSRGRGDHTTGSIRLTEKEWEQI